MLDRINHKGTGSIVNSRWLARLTEVENWRRHHRRRYDSFLIAQMRIWFEWFPNLVFVINYFANLHQNSRPYTNCNRPTRLYNVPKIFLTEIWTWIPNLLLSPEKKPILQQWSWIFLLSSKTLQQISSQALLSTVACLRRQNNWLTTVKYGAIWLRRFISTLWRKKVRNNLEGFNNSADIWTHLNEGAVREACHYFEFYLKLKRLNSVKVTCQGCNIKYSTIFKLQLKKTQVKNVT